MASSASRARTRAAQKRGRRKAEKRERGRQRRHKVLAQVGTTKGLEAEQAAASRELEDEVLRALGPCLPPDARFEWDSDAGYPYLGNLTVVSDGFVHLSESEREDLVRRCDLPDLARGRLDARLYTPEEYEEHQQEISEETARGENPSSLKRRLMQWP